ncbi:MAG: hypothetical protein ACYC08_10370 [Armatimonadota bacterium]
MGGAFHPSKWSSRIRNSAVSALPEIGFYEGDDLMGARGAALAAMDRIADKSIAAALKASGMLSRVIRH